MGLLDFLFPKFCVRCRKLGAYLCTDCFSLIAFSEIGFCSVCQKAAIGGLTHPVCRNTQTIDGIFSSLVYAGVVKKLVYKFKFPPYLSDLQKLLVELFYEGLVQKEVFYRLLQKKSIFIPIPLSVAKQKKRGYNQAELLAHGLSQKFSLRVIDGLQRIKNTKTQIGLTQKERAQNIKDAFVIKKDKEQMILEYEQIFLIDDVVTSGATLREAARILKRKGVAKVFGLTLAHGN